MNYLFEKSDSLNTPFECFFYIPDRDRFPIAPHWHYFMEMIYVLEGEAELCADGKVCMAHKGDLMLFYPKSVHSINSAHPEGLSYAVIKLDINRLTMPSDYTPKLRSIFKSAEQRGMNTFFPAETARKLCAHSVFNTCIDEIKRQRYGYDAVIRSCIHFFLINILREWQEQGFTVDSEVFEKDAGYDIYSITEYIDENLSRGIRVTDIAQMCGMSYSYFAKRFQSVYGKACKEYMEEMRVLKAQEFLLFTDFDLAYISRETGFTDCSHLIRSFKRRIGVTPKQYRSGHRTE